MLCCFWCLNFKPFNFWLMFFWWCFVHSHLYVASSVVGCVYLLMGFVGFGNLYLVSMDLRFLGYVFQTLGSSSILQRDFILTGLSTVLSFQHVEMHCPHRESITRSQKT